jgi:hypothetical protein
LAETTGLHTLAWEVGGAHHEFDITASVVAEASSKHALQAQTGIHDAPVGRTDISLEGRNEDPSVAAATARSVRSESIKPFQRTIAEALERDIISRYEVMVRRSLFPEFRRTDFETLAKEIEGPEYEDISTSMHRRIFLRASRSASVRAALTEAESFLERAQAL